jgi:hypothetical protein
MTKASDLGRRALVFVGRTLVYIGLPIALVIAGGALKQTGSIVEASFALVLCLIPVGLGLALAEIGQRGVWRQAVSLRGLMQSSVGLGLAVAVLSLIPMYAYPPLAALVAFFSLCAFAVLDPALNVTRRSWWWGALASIIVWIVLMSVLVGVADSLQNLRESTMVFLLPFMVYPIALGVSGLARLTGTARGWTASKTFWIAGAVIAAGFGGFVALQLTFAVLPVAIEQITGNTLPNTVYSGQEGKVVTAAPGRLDVQEDGRGPVLYRLTPETQFDLRGPGRGKAASPAGPSWLQPGQRVSIDYVYRQRERQAKLVCIWVERGPCLPNPISPAPGGARSAAPPLSGTVWEGRRVGPRDPPGGGEGMRLEFLEGGAFAATSLDEGPGSRSAGRWTQDQGAVFMQVNDCYARYNGVIEGDSLRGTFDNEVNLHETWNARRISGHP